MFELEGSHIAMRRFELSFTALWNSSVIGSTSTEKLFMEASPGFLGPFYISEWPASGPDASNLLGARVHDHGYCTFDILCKYCIMLVVSFSLDLHLDRSVYFHSQMPQAQPLTLVFRFLFFEMYVTRSAFSVPACKENQKFDTQL